MTQLVAKVGARDERNGGGHALAVRSMFDRIAGSYDLLNRLLSAGVDHRWRMRALAQLEAGLPAEGAVLDLCAGTLDLSAELVRRLPTRQVVALDFAREMLIRGQPKAGGQAWVGVADAQQLPLKERCLAGAICGFGMRNLAQPERGLREVHRVLRPGGRFVVLEFFRPTRVITRAFHASYGQLLLPALGSVISGDRKAYRYLSESMRGFKTRSEFAQMMSDAGFRQVWTQDLTLGIASMVRGIK